MEHGDGQIAAPPRSPAGEDRLSALPEDVIIHILLKLSDAAAAARTSVLSRHWRPLWTLLPDLRFHPATAPHGVRAALESHRAPALRRLDVGVVDATPESVAAWLPFAAGRLSGDLELTNKVQADSTEDEDEDAEGAALELPCFERAASICLLLGYLGLALPSSGVFARLVELCLAYIHLRGPCKLGDAVSTPRCPALRKLAVHHVWGQGQDGFAIRSDSLLEIELKHVGMGDVTIHSESLLRMALKTLHGMHQLNVFAPALGVFDVANCFSTCEAHNPAPVANICAPQLTSLIWNTAYDPSSTLFGNIPILQRLGTYGFFVYGQAQDGSGHQLRNSYCLRLLQRFHAIRSLRFMLVYPPVITNHQYLMKDITRLPHVTCLALDITPQGHSFGASVFHVLRMCSGVRKLQLKLTGPYILEACPSGCVCDQPPNWKTEALMLNCLREVAVLRLRGTTHEADLIKQLFDWATVLEEVTISFHCSVAQSKAKEFFEMVQSFSRSKLSMEGPLFA